MLQAIKRFVREEDGVTALEYGLLAAGIAAAILAASDTIQGFFAAVFDKLTSLVSDAPPTTGN